MATITLFTCWNVHSGCEQLDILTTHAARCGVVVDCHENCKGAHRAISQCKSSYWEVLETFTEHTDQEMMSALATADKAFMSWATRPIEERAKIISRAAQLLLDGRASWLNSTLEMGKRIAESRGEVELSAAILQYLRTTPQSSLHRSPSSPRWEKPILSFLPGCSVEHPAMNTLTTSWRASSGRTSCRQRDAVKHAPGVPSAQCVRAGSEGRRRASWRLHQSLPEQ